MRTSGRAADRITAALGELPPLIGVEQACELLGITRYAGYRAARTGELPTLRWGRRWYVPTARLMAVVGPREKGRS